MSANILKFPERTFRPDLARCRGAIELCEGRSQYAAVRASSGVNLVRNPPALLKPSDSPEQLAVDRLTIAFLALRRGARDRGGSRGAGPS